MWIYTRAGKAATLSLSLSLFHPTGPITLPFDSGILCMTSDTYLSLFSISILSMGFVGPAVKLHLGSGEGGPVTYYTKMPPFEL